MAKMFDTALRMDAAGPGGIPTINNLRFLRHPAWYALDRIAPGFPGPVVPLTRGNGSIVLLRGEEAVRRYFTGNDVFHRMEDGIFALPEGRAWSRMFDAVITFNGERHRRARKLLMPVVHKSAMDHYAAVFADTFKRTRFAAADGEPFDMAAEFLDITRANMLTCLLGLEPDEENVALAHAVHRLLQDSVNPMVFLYQKERGWTPYGKWTRQVADVYERLAGIIERKRAEEPRRDALSILCHTTDEHGDSLSTPEIAGELHGLFAAGFETTAMSMTWALLTILGTPDLEVSDEEQLDAVVRESQRLIPTVPISLPRRVMEDVEIEGAPPIPRGALAFTSPLLEHRDPVAFPDPGAFLPSRWTDARTSPYAFLPFGVGQRRCLGASFADLQVRTTLALILAAGRPQLLTTEVDYHIRSGVTAFPKKAVMVRTGSDGRAAGPLSGTVTKLWKSA
ncbi:putative cytochrome P450 [Acrocarpospora phusangensis]|uniref:Cytochrome P450 n=1 Tax=Acrocarpospora phusangensis TaxID=1070424 RepID=A0A919UKM7_9ACTN|nr:cytochrome P450 [Acrocarpospora phusangensis]GIH25201.1 putative cytochrome P450 [Acrocarpospora phusangensis]